MQPLNWEYRPDGLRAPALICAFKGWNDASDAASSAISFVGAALGARRFATIDPEEFYDFQTVRPRIKLVDGQTRKIEWPELELYDTGHLEMALTLHSEGLLQEPLQFSLVMGVLGGMPATPATLASLIDRMPDESVWQVIGIGRHNLAMTAIGLAMGGNARTGMEDTLMVRRRQPATGNGELTERLATTAKALDRPPATVDQAIEVLQLGQSVSRIAEVG